MGSRNGSIAIFLLIAAIVAAVVVIIVRLDLLDTGQPDAPVIVASLDEGELVLLDEPQSITVTISSGSPITTLELFVDDIRVSEVIPPYSAERGAWIGPFVWTPERLGFAQIRIAALDAQGRQSSHEFQVEVTDDRARVAAALRISVAGIAPLQQFPVNADIGIDISATGSRPIERFDMLLNDDHVASVSPELQEDGRYLARFVWTPPDAGEFRVTIEAIDADGRKESHTIPVIIIEQGAASPITSAGSTGATDETEDDAQAESDTPADEETGGDPSEASARIESPADGQQFVLDDGFALDVELAARNIGPVASALLYITPVRPDNSLGESILIHSTEGRDGDYAERVEGVERFITSSGAYELQLVVFTPQNDRYDHRIAIRVLAGASPDDEDADQGEAAQSGGQIDLGIVRARQAADNPRRLNVSITNSGGVDIERIQITLIVTNIVNGAELGAVDASMALDAQELRTIPLDLDLEPGVEVEAQVLLQSNPDADADNNTYRVALRAVPASGQPQQATDQAADGSDDSDQGQAGQEDTDASQGQSGSSTAPGPVPDLTVIEVQVTSDGYVLLTVANVGDGAASTFAIVIADADGNVLETVTRRQSDTAPLAPGAAEILTSLQPHTGTIALTVAAGAGDGEQNLANNSTTVQIP